MLQTTALQVMKSNRNIFLCGMAGSGKTYTLNKYIEWLLDNGKSPVVTASTGIASVHVGGSTLHSFAGLRDDKTLTDDDIEQILANPFTAKRLAYTKVLVIDEISMVSANLLDMVSLLMMRARNNDKPFGGAQVIVVGDFFQLPPVQGKYAFDSMAWKQANFAPCYLHEQFRQSEGQFLDTLTAIREGTLTEELKNVLRDRVVQDTSGLGVKLRLETHNKNVDDINMRRLKMHEGKAYSFTMRSSGNPKIVAMLKKNCMSPEKLILKEGVPVMMTRNDPELRFVNGSQGTITGFDEETKSIMVELDDRTEVSVERAKWEKAEGYGANKVVIASVTQFPMRLAWAITIHKSQGMTLDSAIIDTTKSFACGQGYVAISRVRNLEKLYFQGFIGAKTFDIDERVREADKRFKLESAKLDNEVEHGNLGNSDSTSDVQSSELL